MKTVDTLLGDYAEKLGTARGALWAASAGVEWAISALLCGDTDGALRVLTKVSQTLIADHDSTEIHK